MANITIQQAYAIAMGAFQNPYALGRLDGGTTFGGGGNQSFNPGTITNANASGTSMLHNRLKVILSNTAVETLGAVPREFSSGGSPQTFSMNSLLYNLVPRTEVLANASGSGFETPIFAPQEYVGATRQNYNYRTGASIDNNGSIAGYEQLYHLTGLGIMRKLKK